MKKSKIYIIIMMLLSLVVACVSFVLLDNIIPIHFGVDGKPDQSGSKYFILIFPAIACLCGVIMLLVSKSTKITDNYKKYLLLTGVIIETMFLILMGVMVVFGMLYAQDTPPFDISKVLMPLFGLMFIVLGNYMPKIEKNRTLGMKTAWSMYNEVTWQKTHRFTGFVSIIAGVLILVLGIFFKDMVNFIILMVLVFVVVISSTIASYYFYKQEKAKEQ